MKNILKEFKKQGMTILSGVLGLFLLLSFSTHYTVDPLSNLSSDTGRKRVIITSKVFNASDSKKYLSRDLLSRGFQPIQLTIHNNTTSTVSIEDVDMPQVAPSKVALKVTKDAVPRAIGYKIASLIFWPFMIPSTIDGIRTLNTHSKMVADFEAKAVKSEAILPYSVVQRILFIKDKDFKKHTKVQIYDQTTGKTESYKVNLS